MFITKRKDGVKWQFRRLGLNMRVLSKNYLWEKFVINEWLLITVFGYVISIRINFPYWIKRSGISKETRDAVDKFYDEFYNKIHGKDK